MGWVNKPTKTLTPQAEALVDKRTRAAALVAFTTAVSNTPVDTGRLRSNWQLGVGELPEGSVLGFEDGEGGTNYEPPLIPDLRPGATYGKVIYIVNNLPYAEIINDGAENRIAHNMVALATKAAEDWLEQNK